MGLSFSSGGAILPVDDGWTDWRFLVESPAHGATVKVRKLRSISGYDPVRFTASRVDARLMDSAFAIIHQRLQHSFFSYKTFGSLYGLLQLYRRLLRRRPEPQHGQMAGQRAVHGSDL